jgi:hypothetical protein
LEKHFKDRELSEIPVQISQKVKPRDKSPRMYKFSLELLPIYPAGYRLTEYASAKAVNTNKINVTNPRLFYVAGCGNDGCNAYFNICEDVPAGAQIIGAGDYYDSFVGWGGFAAAIPNSTGTGMCAKYWQHSHNVGRNVGFSVRYHPLESATVERDLPLTPFSINKSPLETTRISADTTSAETRKGVIRQSNAALNSYISVTSPVPVEGIVKTRPMQSFDTRAKFEGGPQQSFPPKQQVINDYGGVRFGRTYSARFSADMQSFDLVFRLFTGEEIVVTPGKSDSTVEASPLEDLTTFKRMTVKLVEPKL